MFEAEASAINLVKASEGRLEARIVVRRHLVRLIEHWNHRNALLEALISLRRNCSEKNKETILIIIEIATLCFCKYIRIKL